MEKGYQVICGHTFHENKSKYYSDGEMFIIDEERVKGQEYKLKEVRKKKVKYYKKKALTKAENRAITKAENRGL